MSARRFLGAVALALVLASAAGASSPRVTAFVATGRSPCGVAAAFGAVWVASYDEGTVARIDPRRNRVTRTLRVGRTACWLKAGAGALWVVRDGASAVVRIDGKTLARRSIAVDDVPFDVAYGFGAIWVTSFAEGSLLRIDPSKRRVARRIVLGGHPAGIALGFGAVWVGFGRGATAVARVDPTTGKTVRVPVGQRDPGRLLTTADAVWVTTAQDTTVRIDPASNRVVATLRTGDTPAQPARAPDGSVWVPAKASNTISRIDPGTNRVVGTLGAGPGAFSAVTAFGSVWVTSFAGSDVWRFAPA